MNTQLKLLLEEMIKNKVPAEVNGIETKVALREVKPEFYAYDKYTEKDIKIIICPRYIKPELSVFIRIQPSMLPYDFSKTSVKCIKFTLKDLESKLSTEELGPYKLRVATEMVVTESDDEARKEKLRNVCFSALKWSQNIDEAKKGFYR